LSNEKLDEIINGGCSEEGCDCCGHDHEGHEDCDCGCDHEHGNMVVDLEDENGNIVPCEIVDGFNFKDNEYVLVQNPEDGSTYLFKVQGEGEDGELIIPDDDEFEEVSAYYEGLSEVED
jgi:uncharacterized protein YrzB (UPF0473 family)